MKKVEVYEIWKTIKEFPNYEVSNLGRIHNKNDGRLMSISHNNYGHSKITLASESDHHRYTRSVTQLVAQLFVEKPNDLCDTVVILDGDLFNIAAHNIAWRPRWFAWSYSRQLKTQQPLNYHNLPVVNTVTGDTYVSIVEAGIAEGLLFIDIWKSTYMNNSIFPHGHSFEIIRQSM